MAYRAGETMRLEDVDKLGIHPNAILDIGAHSVSFIVGLKGFGVMLAYL